MKSLGLFLLTTTVLALPLQAQFTKPVATSITELSASIQERNEHRTQSILHAYPIRNVGPVTMSGRISDIAAVRYHANFLCGLWFGRYFQNNQWWNYNGTCF